jgi:hypothetical protein
LIGYIGLFDKTGLTFFEVSVLQELKKGTLRFEMMKSHQNALEKGFEELIGYFDNFSELLNEFVYDGKKAAAATSRAALMDITKKAKELRMTIQEAKVKLKPIYKD